MQTPVRYYITCDDDRPVVRTIPVAVRGSEAREDVAAAAPATQNTPDDQRDVRRPRVSRLALAKARRLRHHAQRS